MSAQDILSLLEDPQILVIVPEEVLKAGSLFRVVEPFFDQEGLRLQTSFRVGLVDNAVMQYLSAKDALTEDWQRALSGYCHIALFAGEDAYEIAKHLAEAEGVEGKAEITVTPEQFLWAVQIFRLEEYLKR